MFARGRIFFFLFSPPLFFPTDDGIVSSTKIYYTRFQRITSLVWQACISEARLECKRSCRLDVIIIIIIIIISTHEQVARTVTFEPMARGTDLQVRPHLFATLCYTPMHLSTGASNIYVARA